MRLLFIIPLVVYSTKPEIWVACGIINIVVSSGNTLAYSKDGITWTGSGATLYGNTPARICYNVAYSPTQDLWVSTGDGTNGNTIGYSTDGVTWTGLGKSTFSSYARCIDCTM